MRDLACLPQCEQTHELALNMAAYWDRKHNAKVRVARFNQIMSARATAKSV